MDSNKIITCGFIPPDGEAIQLPDGSGLLYFSISAKKHISELCVISASQNSQVFDHHFNFTCLFSEEPDLILSSFGPYTGFLIQVYRWIAVNIRESSLVCTGDLWSWSILNEYKKLGYSIDIVPAIHPDQLSELLKTNVTSWAF